MSLREELELHCMDREYLLDHAANSNLFINLLCNCFCRVEPVLVNGVENQKPTKFSEDKVHYRSVMNSCA